jgi:hypothetical protein
MAYEPADVYVYLIRAPKKAPSFPGHASNQYARPAVTRCFVEGTLRVRLVGVSESSVGKNGPMTREPTPLASRFTWNVASRSEAGPLR